MPGRLTSSILTGPPDGLSVVIVTVVGGCSGVGDTLSVDNTSSSIGTTHTSSLCGRVCGVWAGYMHVIAVRGIIITLSDVVEMFVAPHSHQPL